jgi:DMSO/TMAO reductase YedYZ molybdopterin-dependent catalytic subunit
MSTRLLAVVVVLAAVLLVVSVSSCGCTLPNGTAEVSVSTTVASAIPGSTTTGVAAGDDLEPVVQPTLPADVPSYLEVDPATGLHMTGTPTVVEISTYRLKVTGKVDHELSLAYDELRALPRVTASPELVCPDYFWDHATWTGVPLNLILEMAGPQLDAERMVLVGADNYSTGLYLTEALVSDGFLAYELNGETLPALQGFPIRAVFPELEGSLWAKWLVEIRLE